MPEDRLIELIFQVQDSFQSFLQWWLGVSIGVAALGHFIAKKLNLPMLILICTLYTGFTYLALKQLNLRGSELGGLLEDLTQLSATGRVSAAAQSILRDAAGSPVSNFVALLTLFGAFLGCLTFLVWNFVQARKKSQA
jgi:hypothetical protein